ncbi:ACT domain-containing protein ACR8 [Hibiscus syriacus]|uniref:ACT domain-containing protein ACR n=1 Tax=Hibiscus syriacus TaxID=106335 RepID=A0A6A2YPN1_HIBSY|nr:ACT domain-containing protein ACR8 [Hibiscus syriacus]
MKKVDLENLEAKKAQTNKRFGNSYSAPFSKCNKGQQQKSYSSSASTGRKRFARGKSKQTQTVSTGTQGSGFRPIEKCKICGRKHPAGPQKGRGGKGGKPSTFEDASNREGKTTVRVYHIKTDDDKDAPEILAFFHVTDLNGNKLTDARVISYIEQSLENTHLDAILADLQCAVVDAKVWTQNGRIASLIFLKDCNSGSPIEDSQQIDKIDARLRNVLKGDTDIRRARTSVSMAVMHTERRLHQMMFADRDNERKPILQHKSDLPVVTVQNWVERGYSVVNVQCKDQTKLLFDVVCTLTDMQYVVLHATIKTSGDKAYVRTLLGAIAGVAGYSDGGETAILWALSPFRIGVRLELHTLDKQGLLADVTRTFRENGLNVTRTEISTTSDVVLNVYYVTDATGNTADPKIIESVRQKIGLANLKELPLIHYRKAESEEQQAVGVGGAVLLSLGSLVRRNLYNLGD